MVVTTYSQARANLASLMDKVVDDAEEVRITRRGKPDVVLVSAEQLDSWRETIYLLRSPANAVRLAEALEAAQRGEGVAMSLDEIKRDAGLGSA